MDKLHIPEWMRERDTRIGKLAIEVIVSIATVTLLCLGCQGCQPKPVPPPNPPPAAVDGAVPVSCTCAGYCENLSRHFCKGAEPTPAGASCLEVCNNTQQSGIVQHDLCCRQTAGTCSAIEACP